MTKSFCILCAFPLAFAVKRFNRKENTKFVARTAKEYQAVYNPFNSFKL
ncbi:MAG TPA: hypothetical protein VJ111_00520 [Chitinophagaceae bacterium]|nr:hypothetical protein [Chitinophagaceae bacterium]